MARKVYGIFGVVERYISVNLGKGSVNITFSGGTIDNSGITPATLTTDSIFTQTLVENLPDFKTGKIKLLRTDGASEVKSQVPKTIKVHDVANLQEARNYLLEKGAEMKDVASKKDILATAEKMGVEFPNMK